MEYDLIDIFSDKNTTFLSNLSVKELIKTLETQSKELITDLKSDSR